MVDKKVDSIPVEEHEQILETLHEEIRRKDVIIEKLKEENMLIVKASLRGSKELERWKEIAMNAKQEKPADKPIEKPQKIGKLLDS